MVFEILRDFTFTEFVFAARFGYVGEVSVLGKLVSETLCDEDLPRRIGEMFFSTDDMSDFQFRIIHDAGQMVEASPIGFLDDHVLFKSPFEFDITSNQIRDETGAFARHFETYDGCPPLGFEGVRLFISFRHPATTVDKGSFFSLSGFSFCLDFVGSAVVLIGCAIGQHLFDGSLIFIGPL